MSGSVRRSGGRALHGSNSKGRNHVDEIILRLPPRDYAISQGHTRAQYGAFSLAARYAGLPEEPAERFGEWQHGWHPPEHNVHPEITIGSSGQARTSDSWRHKFWVFREDQESYLRAEGLRYVRAIGHAFAYLELPEVPRIPGSVLVMPPHSVGETRDQWFGHPYVRYVASLKDHFECVAACVTPSCISKGHWVGDFANADVPVIDGADVGDRNSLLRMAVLFSSFEYVTMPGMGSQLAYSAYYGAKPSISGPAVQTSVDTLKEIPVYQNCPELIDLVLSLRTLEPKSFARFHVSPWLATEARDWGAFQLGIKHRLSPRNLRAELRWTPKWRAVAIARENWRRLRGPRQLGQCAP